MHVTITGATGFVGKNLVPYLERNSCTLTALSLRGNWNLPERTDAIVHLAGKAHDLKNTSDADDYFKVNTVLTQELFDLFLESDARVFVYFSSVKAAADKVPGVLDEDAVPQPATPYGISKRKAEEYLLAKKLPAGKKLFILRPCMIHGPGNKGNLNLLYKFVQKGIPYPLAAFQNKRSFLGIDNLNFVVKSLLERDDVPSGIYNIADDASFSTNELVQLIAATTGKRALLMPVPKTLLSALSKLGDLFRLPLNSSTLQKLTENYVVSNQKIKTALGITALPATTREGLIKTIAAFRPE